MSAFAPIRPLDCVLLAALAAVAAAPLPAAAQSKGNSSGKSPFSFDAGVGYRYNSRLAVPDLDIASTQGDSALLSKAGVDLDLDLTKDTRFSAGYSFSDTSYRTYDAFDVRSHIGSLGLKHDFGPVDAGVSYHQARSDLGGRAYLDYHRLSTHVSADLGRSARIRGTLARTEKDYEQAPDRDASVRAAGVDAYWFLQGRGTYLTAGYLNERNEALAPQFDYDAHTYSLRFVRGFSMVERDARFKVGYRHEQRDYDAVTPSIGEVRNETRNSFEGELRVDLTEHLFASLEHEINDRSSNLPAADFSQNVTSLLIGAKF